MPGILLSDRYYQFVHRISYIVIKSGEYNTQYSGDPPMKLLLLIHNLLIVAPVRILPKSK